MPMAFRIPNLGLLRGSVAGPLAAPRAARSGLRAPRWPACFARRGITRRLPFASGAAVKVPPPSLAHCPGRPEQASSPEPRRTFQTRAQQSGRVAVRLARSFRAAAGPPVSRSVCGPVRGWRAGCGRSAGLPQPASRGLSRRTASPGGAMDVATLPSTGQCAKQHTRDHQNRPDHLTLRLSFLESS